MGRLQTLRPRVAALNTSKVKPLLSPSAQRDRGRPWRRAREQALRRDNGLCVLCSKAGRVTLATEVDHVVPLEEGGDQYDLPNLRSVCSPCHAEVTAAQARRRYGR